MIINSEYEKILEKIEFLIGTKGETSNFQLDELGEQLFGDKWLDCFSADQCHKQLLQPTGIYYSILNQDTSNGHGFHWLGIYKEDKHVYIFDSFERHSYKLVDPLVKFLKERQENVEDGDLILGKFKQHDSEDNCGQRSMAWLWLVKKYGINTARLLGNS